MPAYIKTSSTWRSASQIWVKLSSTWRSVSQGWINVSGTWRQFFGSGNTYTFSFGNTVHIGTNGYISLDGGQSAISISSTVDRVLGILPADLELNSIRYAADSSKFYVFYRGKRFSVGTNFEIEYEVHFTNGQDYALIKLVAFPTSTYSLTGYYVDGSSVGYSRITSTRTVGAEYRVYFGTTAAFATSFTEYGVASHPVWLSQGSVTSGSADDGYITVVANQGASAQAPTSVTASSIGKTTATISWSAITNANAGMSAIQSYDYSINGGSSWTSTSTNTSVSLTGLTASTSYTVLVRANNYFFTGTNYGSVTFDTTAGPVNTVLPSLSTDTTNFSSGSIITVSEGTWTGANSYKYEILYASGTPVPTNSAAYTANASNQYTITVSDATAPSFYFRAKVTGYDGLSQTGDSVIAYGVTSSRSYIVPTTTISVGTATSTGFTISGTAGPVTSGARYVSISEIYIYNSSQTLTATISTGLPTIALSTGDWSYVWTGGAASTTYYAKVKVASTSSDVQEFTTAFSSSITTSAVSYNPVVWGTMNAPAFNRNNSLSRLRWGWNNQNPTSGDYTASNITWEWQYSTANTSTGQGSNPTGLITSGTRPRRTGGGLVVGASSFDNRVSTLSDDYSSPNNIASATEPVTFNTNPRYLRYRAVVVGSDGLTYRSNYSVWV